MRKVKYFCDLCEEEVEDLTYMSSFILNQNDLQSHNKLTMFECDICSTCFDEIRETIYKLKED